MAEGILYPAHNKGRLVAAYAGYRVLEHPCGFEVTFAGWHLTTVRTYPEVLDCVSQYVVLSAAQAAAREVRQHG